METNNINIEEIMADIKREIKEKGLTNDMLSFDEVPYKRTSAGGSVQDALCYIKENYTVQPYKQLSGNPLKVLFKKVIRKLTKFYVEPVVEEQNCFNANAVTVISDLAESDTSTLSARVEALELANKELMLRLDRLEQENIALRQQSGKQG